MICKTPAALEEKYCAMQLTCKATRWQHQPTYELCCCSPLVSLGCSLDWLSGRILSDLHQFGSDTDSLSSFRQSNVSRLAFEESSS